MSVTRRIFKPLWRIEKIGHFKRLENQTNEGIVRLRSKCLRVESATLGGAAMLCKGIVACAVGVFCGFDE
jgi:hypothetical protein